MAYPNWQSMNTSSLRMHRSVFPHSGSSHLQQGGLQTPSCPADEPNPPVTPIKVQSDRGDGLRISSPLVSSSSPQAMPTRSPLTNPTSATVTNDLPLTICNSSELESTFTLYQFHHDIDPRDLEAPTRDEKLSIWRALEPTRTQYGHITQSVLSITEMYSLSLGYGYAWAEIKRKLTTWLCANCAPGSDRTEHVKSLQIHRAYKAARESGRTIIMARSGEIEEFTKVIGKAPVGYATVGTRRVGELEMGKDDDGSAKRQIIRDKMLETWFDKQAEWIRNPAKVLFKLERWTGGIADYETAPNWWGRERKAFEMIYG